MSNFVRLEEAQAYDVIGEIALWQKETKKGDAYLGGTFTLGHAKLSIVLFPTTGEQKAAMKGSISMKEGSTYTKIAWVSLFKSTKENSKSAYFGYVNPMKDSVGQMALFNFSFDLKRHDLEEESKRPLFTGDVKVNPKKDSVKAVPVTSEGFIF